MPLPTIIEEDEQTTRSLVGKSGDQIGKKDYQFIIPKKLGYFDAVLLVYKP